MYVKSSEKRSRQQLVDYSKLLWEKSWVANHDGNLSMRLSPDRFLCTPTSFSKRLVDEDALLQVDAQGKKIAGALRPFGELELHLAVYAGRADVNAVIHAHPPYASAMSCAGVGLDEPIIAEAVVSIGTCVPLVPFACPGSGETVKQLAPFVPVFDVVLLENHGVMAWGSDLEQAFLRLELAEHLCKIATLAKPWGGAKALPNDAIGRLLEARRRAGLGPEARGIDIAGMRRVAPAASSTATTAVQPSREDLVRIITEELKSLIR
ncbi:MAG: class II aldolase/adducin family protein [Myxococcota bacterium]|jgi:L-fuculose-phosphate aldolase|nr:class II aldolase/adducin family protein [Myxococcota bacterium]